MMGRRAWLVALPMIHPLFPCLDLRVRHPLLPSFASSAPRQSVYLSATRYHPGKRGGDQYVAVRAVIASFTSINTPFMACLRPLGIGYG